MTMAGVLGLSGCSAPSSNSAEREIATDQYACALKMATSRGDVGLGFPKIADRTPSTGTVNTAVIFVDFDDEPSTKTPEEAFSIIEGAPATFSEVSYGTLNYVMKPMFTWLRMSKNASDYSYKDFYTHQDFVVEALKLADENGYDFSGIDNFVIVTNPDGTTFNNGPAFTGASNDGIVLDGTRLINGATSGADMVGWGSMWLNHEITHTMSLGDDYSFDGDTEAMWHRHVGQFGYMGYSSLDSNAPGLFAFERWQLGWLEDEQVSCLSPEGGTVTLENIEMPGGTKVAMLPLSDTQAIAVESRRPLGIDSKLEKSGALVYVLDTKKESGFGPIAVQSNTKQSNDQWLKQAPLAVGESITVGDYTVSVKSATDTSDTVSITKNK